MHIGDQVLATCQTQMLLLVERRGLWTYNRHAIKVTKPVGQSVSLSVVIYHHQEPA